MLRLALAIAFVLVATEAHPQLESPLYVVGSACAPTTAQDKEPVCTLTYLPFGFVYKKHFHEGMWARGSRLPMLSTTGQTASAKPKD